MLSPARLSHRSPVYVASASSSAMPIDGRGDQEQRPQVGRGDREGDRAPRDEVVDQVLQRPRLRQVGERHQHRRRGRAAEGAPVAPDDLPDQLVRATGARMGAVVVLGGCGVRGAAAEHRAIPARERASCTARLRHIPARENRLRYASAGASASATRATSATSTGGGAARAADAGGVEHVGPRAVVARQPVDERAADLVPVEVVVVVRLPVDGRRRRRPGPPPRPPRPRGAPAGRRAGGPPRTRSRATRAGCTR